MEDTFFKYLQRLELIAFFSGYPLIYAIVFFIIGNRPSNNNWKDKIVGLLPFAYALVGTLYLGLQLRKLYPDYSIENLKQSVHQPFLFGWGMLALVFWIPSVARKPVLSLLHSFVFFYLLIKDLFFQLPAFATDKNIVRNDMKLYTDSLLLNIGALAAVTLIYFLYRQVKTNNDSSGLHP